MAWDGNRSDKPYPKKRRIETSRSARRNVSRIEPNPSTAHTTNSFNNTAGHTEYRPSGA